MHPGYGWQALASMLCDAAWYALWYLYGGLVASGACWFTGYGGYRAWQEWDREWLRRREERRINKEAIRGLRAVEDFLQHQTPVATNSPEPPKDTKGSRKARPQD